MQLGVPAGLPTPSPTSAHSAVEELGRPRWPHKPETVGSNPTRATQHQPAPHGGCMSRTERLLSMGLVAYCAVGGAVIYLAYVLGL